MRLPVLALPPSPRQLINKLPGIVLQPVIHSPFLFQRLALQGILKQVFREAISDGDFDFLQGRFLKVEIRDIRLCWFFSFDGRHITVHRHARADASISGELREFLLLAARREDPDTLFFQRRLQIDGDTELGLEVKNLLDTLDLDNLPLPMRKGMDHLATIFG